MTSDLRITLAQCNFTVGDIAGNTQKIIAAAQTAKKEHHADLVVFPELAITGYPPEDLLHRVTFLDKAKAALTQIAETVTDIDMLIGYPDRTSEGTCNAAAWIREGKIITNYYKQKLPNYSVFDEERYFTMGYTPAIVTIKGIRCGILICEDIWFPEPALEAKAAGAQCLLCINASPYSINKRQERETVIRNRVRETGLPIVYVNTVGGQDELIFDGGSMAIASNGDIIAQADFFKETLCSVDFNSNTLSIMAKQANVAIPEKLASIYQALVLNVRDYAAKNGFSHGIIGLSGGIDSALTLAIAADALGAKNITAVMMPSEYTSNLSLEGAQAQADMLGVAYKIIPIHTIYQNFYEVLSPHFANQPKDITEENLQARIRGTLLMALSNKTGHLVLSTGNKSEMAVGYSTLYGDMVGGFCVLKDVLKTTVYALSAYRNTLSPAIPQAVIDRAPSAELAPNQTDQDSLPPYDALDQILIQFIEKDVDYEDIVAQGFDPEITQRVIRMVLRNEYKRRQAPPGPRITEKAFGRDRRYPITARYCIE